MIHFSRPRKNQRECSPQSGANSRRVRAWFCLILMAETACFGQSYTITDLGSSSWSYSAAHGINGAGLVAGEYEPTNFFYVLAFLFQNGSLSDLGHLSGTPYAIAYGINSTNVVGESDTATSTHAFRYDLTTQKMTDLGTLGGLTGYSSAHAINRAGQTVGESSLPGAQANIIHAVLYDNTTKTDLGALGGDYSSASAINSSGVIVGESDIVNQGVTNVHGFIYANNTISDLGTLAGGSYSSARGINDAGVIVGESDTLVGGATYTHAFIYNNGTMTDLGTLGGTASSASAINTAGQIVGYATDTNEVSNAFLYDGSRMINLNDFIPPGSSWTNLSSADAINDAGQIAGSGYLADGSYQGYLLTITVTNGTATAVTLLNPMFSGNSFSFSFATQTGVTYQGQFTSPLSTTNNWSSFTNFVGNGSTVRVSDSSLTQDQRYYRVLAY